MKLGLRQYVKRRNGVPLGHSQSLGNMFRRAFGARSFDGFWVYWNPIWSYYLARFVFRPCAAKVGEKLGYWFTFIVSGALHDVIVGLVVGEAIFTFTPFFAVLGATALGFKVTGYRYSSQHFLIASLFNGSIIVFSFYLSSVFSELLVW